MSVSLFLRLLPYDDKAAALTEAVAAVRKGGVLNIAVHAVDPASFRQVPGSPFAYWVSDRIRQLFAELPPFESEGRTAKRGPSTGDDGRRVRTWWEVNPGAIGRKSRWVPFSKGGVYSPYYADIHLLVAWDDSRRTFLDFWGRPGRMIERPEALEFFFQAGLTWPRRTTSGISVRVLPEGCVFADKGPTAFATDRELICLLALMNSPVFEGFVILRLGAADAAARSYEVGIIQDTPIPDLSNACGSRLAELAAVCVDLRRDLDRANEISHVFLLPALLQVSSGTLSERFASWQVRIAETERQLAECQREIDDIAFRLYGIEGEDRRAIEEVTKGVTSDEWLVMSKEDNEDGDTEGDIENQSLVTRHSSLVTDLLSYALGCSFGHWDVRFATSEKQAPELPDPFAPLPVCSPGMLTGSDGLPLQKAPPSYPISIDWDGIFVDDPDHPDDIIRRVRAMLEVLWKERAEAIEQEACELLGFKELRDYFRKSSKDGFWNDHVSRYSKSRRKAPIYWLLQSSKKNYALWLYYHRLDKDIPFKALLNYVEPKIRLEESRLDSLRSQKQAAGETGKGSKKLDKEIEQQDDLLSELRDFEDKLRRAADLHLDPDLNDGVVLNIAPLHELVPWKEAKNYWEELLAGKYEWSSIGKQLRAKGLVK